MVFVYSPALGRRLAHHPAVTGSEILDDDASVYSFRRVLRCHAGDLVAHENISNIGEAAVLEGRRAVLPLTPFVQNLERCDQAALR
jgi:hypothetical protein